MGLLYQIVKWFWIGVQNKDLSAYRDTFKVTQSYRSLDARVTYDYFNFRRSYLLVNQVMILLGVICMRPFASDIELIFMWLMFESMEIAFTIQFGRVYLSLSENKFNDKIWPSIRKKLNFYSTFVTLSIFIALLYGLPYKFTQELIVIYLFIMLLTSATNFYSLKLNLYLLVFQVVFASLSAIVFYFFGKIEILPEYQVTILVPVVLAIVASHTIISWYAKIYWNSLREEQRLYLAQKQIEESNRLVQREKYIVDTIHSTIRDAIVVVDRKGKILRANLAFKLMFEIEDWEELEINISELLPQQSLVIDNTKRALELENGTHILIEGAPLYFEGQDERGLYVIADVTERVKADQISQSSQKLSALGTLSGGIAHDFHNSLAVIQANVELIEMSKNLAVIKSEYLQDIKVTLQNASGLTRQILTFVRNAPLKLDLLSAQKIANNAKHFTKNLIKPSHELIIQCTTNHSILCDQSLLQNALLNLVLNARDAQPKGGEIQLKVFREGPNHVAFTVTDSGIGMSREFIERAADPFFTSKPLEKGTGMGLALVKQFAQRSGGAFRIKSEIDEGTSITISLPSQGVKRVPAKKKRKYSDMEISGKKILIVEDNTLLAKSLQTQMHMKSHEAEVAHSLTEVEKLPNLDFDFVLCDMALMSETGIDVYNYFKSHGSQSKFIFMSGNPSAEIPQDFDKVRYSAFLEKPIKIEKLIEKMSTPNPDHTES